MYIEVSNGTATVREAENLKALSVVAPGGVAHPDALAPLGRVDGNHVWLSVQALRESAAATIPEADRAQWVQGFDGMIAYAASKGWTDEAGTHVRAHVEAPA